MAVYTEKKTYHTKAHMGMIDVTEDFQHAVEEACRQHGISAGTVTGFTTGGVAGLTTLEFEPGIVNHDLKAALDVFSPYLDEKGRVVPYWHHETWHDDNGSSHIKAALLSPFITVPFVNGKITVGPWQNLTLIECDTRDRMRDIVFQVMGEQAARRLQKDHSMTKETRPGMGAFFFAYCCRKAQKIDCNLCRVVVSFFYCPLKGCHRKALNRERGEPWKSGTACPRPSAW